MRLFTASIIAITVLSCSSDPETIQGEEPGAPGAAVIEESVFSTKDTSVEASIVGTWDLTMIDNERITKEHNMRGIKQVFLDDMGWVIARPVPEGDSTIMAFEGGKWTYDSNAKQLSVIFLSDSTMITTFLIDVNDAKMQVETESGEVWTWSKTDDLSDLEPLYPDGIPEESQE